MASAAQAHGYSPPLLDSSLGDRIGRAMAVLLVYLIYSRAHELLPVRAHLALILTAATLAFVFFSGGLVRAVDSRPGKLLAAFTVWFLVTIPFSLFRTGSLRILASTFCFAIVCFLATAGLRTFAQLRQFLWAIIAGVWTITAVALYGDRLSSDRLALSSGTLNNPNDLALYLNFGLPFGMLAVLDPARSSVTRLFAALAAVLNAYVTLRTGSRMGLLALITITVLFFFRGSLRSAGVGAGVLLFVGALLLAVLPKGWTERYRTVFESESAIIAQAQAGVGSLEASRAAGSAMDRKRAIRAGLAMTLEHPIFGVGPGQFGTAMASAPEWNLSWRQPHNTYTQLLSETGIPGFALYVWAVGSCIRRSYRIHKLTKHRPACQQMSNLAFCLFAALVTLAVVFMFGHLAYSFMPLLLCGLAMSLERIYAAEVATRPATAAATGAGLPGTGKPQLRRSALELRVPAHGA